MTRELEQRLSRIQTQWTLMFQAHQEPDEAGTAGQRELLLRYYGAAYRYLLGTLRDAEAAEELAQEFAIRFLRGDFRRVDPQRGRFRDFLKTSLRNLAINYWERKRKEKESGPRPLPDEGGPAVNPDPADLDHDPAFLASWREELLARTWEALAEAGEGSGSPYHAVLRYKIDHPEARSATMAEELGKQLGKTFTEAGVRQALHRARQLFADLLVEEVARSLQTKDRDRLEEELTEVGLLDYCRVALQRHEQSS